MMKIGTHEFDLHHKTYLMGILNITPDSFSDGGKWLTTDAAVHHVGEMIRDGADVIDIGGESTRPGHTQIAEEEEISRILPVLTKIKETYDIPVSVDTYKSRVAKAAIDVGADLINDIWGLKYDADMAKVIAQAGVFCCLMHNRTDMRYGNFLRDMTADLKETVQIAQKAGIRNDRILLDPGIGFAKTYENNLEAIRNLDQLHALGYPLLLGTSRKSVIGTALDLPVTERVEGTLVTTVFAVLARCAFVRVHDVKENARAVRMAEEILYQRM